MNEQYISFLGLSANEKPVRGRKKTLQPLTTRSYRWFGTKKQKNYDQPITLHHKPPFGTDPLGWIQTFPVSAEKPNLKQIITYFHFVDNQYLLIF